MSWDDWSSTGPPRAGETSSTEPKRHGNRISEAKEKRIVELDAKEGLPRVVISERLGVTVRTIQTYLTRHGRPMQNRGMRAKKLRGG
jgi:hypothetical protein